nr:immunoglobulin light chain junction region [Macaca mulatta]MOW17529.1 immunoglobulin light chain junction region [Macaca mulatta]
DYHCQVWDTNSDHGFF